MSILGKILGGIFGRKKPEAAPRPAPSATAPQPAPASTPSPSASPPPTAGQPGAAGLGTSPQPQDVDVAAMLDAMNDEAGQRLNWRTSIVDLMKLVGMESSLAERRELADELGYDGDKGDTAAMNMWLHRQVLKRIRENGGQLPADLAD
ncbi:DUF3597 domain-containing protein [Brevundimonas sp.]|uniref:DUF3597 domain-containing protein n=1 Tax=Brevundimonas sp. TaxID=1871086 RepID=UPI0035B26E29